MAMVDTSILPANSRKAQSAIFPNAGNIFQKTRACGPLAASALGSYTRKQRQARLWYHWHHQRLWRAREGALVARHRAHRGGTRADAHLEQLSTFLYFPDERFDWRKRSANNNPVSGRSQMSPGSIGNASGFYMQIHSVNDALLHVFQHVDFGALRAETLDDCAFVGGNGVGRNVITQQIVSTDFQDDMFVPGGTAESRRARTPLVVSPLMPWFAKVTWWPLALNAASN
jgi:hypothetical protein